LTHAVSVFSEGPFHRRSSTVSVCVSAGRIDAAHLWCGPSGLRRVMLVYDSLPSDAALTSLSARPGRAQEVLHVLGEYGGNVGWQEHEEPVDV
jgi:hypothetical protein